MAPNPKVVFSFRGWGSPLEAPSRFFGVFPWLASPPPAGSCLLQGAPAPAPSLLQYAPAPVNGARSLQLQRLSTSYPHLYLSYPHLSMSYPQVIHISKLVIHKLFTWITHVIHNLSTKEVIREGSLSPLFCSFAQTIWNYFYQLKASNWTNCARFEKKLKKF